MTVNIPPTAISPSMAGDEKLFSQNVRDVFFGYDEFALPPQDKLTLEQDAIFSLRIPVTSC